MAKSLKLVLITAIACLSHVMFVNTAGAQTVLPEECKTSAVDDDSDGLIEICHLEDLYAIRFVLDGSGYKADSEATTSTLGCPSSGCIGYELVRDLDFDDDGSYSSTANKITWAMGEGWQPIGNSFSNAFTGLLEGGGYTISGLMISRPDANDIGLFGYTRSGAEITNLGLLDVDITASSYVGSLVGSNLRGTITNSYATGYASGIGSLAGGLVGYNRSGTITNSYAMVSVSGSPVGGLVGFNDDDNSIITNSYATGPVNGSSIVGGLAGQNRGIITNSYAIGSVTGGRSSVVV